MTQGNTLSAKQVARQIDTDAKTLRKFLRDESSGYKPVGQGGRYDFPEAEIPVIKKAFDEWRNGRPTRRSRTTPATRTEGTTTSASSTRVNARPRPMNPLEEDDFHTRITMSIGERARKHGVTVKGSRWIPSPTKSPEQHPVEQEEVREHPDPEQEPTDEEILALEDEELDLDLDA